MNIPKHLIPELIQRQVKIIAEHKAQIAAHQKVVRRKQMECLLAIEMLKYLQKKAKEQ